MDIRTSDATAINQGAWAIAVTLAAMATSEVSPFTAPRLPKDSRAGRIE
jgi:hypothetical protein